MDNLARSCHACNRFKSDLLTGFDPLTQQEVQLFNPRRNLWAELVQMDIERLEVVGLSPAGRATVARLQMNRQRHIDARFRWMQLGLLL